MAIKPSDAIAILSIVVSTLLGFAVIKSGYEAWESGSIPPKKVEYSIFSAQDPLEDFPDEPKELSVQIRSGNETLSRVWAVQTFLTNEGKSPILPSDIFEPFSINVDHPWRIVAVSNNKTWSKYAVRAKWKRESDQSYSMLPALMNPNDLVSATVYLTLIDGEKINKETKPKLSWVARVSNLDKINEKEEKSYLKPPLGPDISITHEGWAVIFLVILFFCQIALSTLLISTKIVAEFQTLKFAIILAILGTINLCASESLTTFIFPSRFSYLMGSAFWMNFPILLINYGLFFYLYTLKPKPTK